MEATPREIFLSPTSANIAYADEALPIECGQTISQPFIVAYMTGKLDLSEDMCVLEIGTGSGYQTAILSRLAAHVFSVEIHAALAEAAAQRLARLHITNVTIACGDGRKGWPEEAPFDRILVTAAARVIPHALIDQLKAGGRLVLPLGPNPRNQHLTLITKLDHDFDSEKLIPVRFVPLIRAVQK